MITLDESIAIYNKWKGTGLLEGLEMTQAIYCAIALNDGAKLLVKYSQQPENELRSEFISGLFIPAIRRKFDESGFNIDIFGKNFFKYMEEHQTEYDEMVTIQRRLRELYSKNRQFAYDLELLWLEEHIDNIKCN